MTPAKIAIRMSRIDDGEAAERGLVVLEAGPEELPRRLPLDRSGDARDVGGRALDLADDAHAIPLAVMTREL